MIVVLTGGTGLVGQALGQKLSAKNYKIHLLTRKLQDVSYPCEQFLWPDVTADLPQKAFPREENYGVIHLAGESVFQWPWTRKVKEKIYLSRVEGAKKLIAIMKTLSHSPQFFLSASATGIYGDQGDQILTEASPISDQNLFLQKVCKNWEAEALKASSVYRTLICRFGVVMSYKKGFLYEQVKWIKRGFLPLILTQNPLWLSWIALEDLDSMILWAIENKKASGIYNAVSPKPVLLKDFYKVFAKQIKYKGIKIPSPLFLMKLVGGEMAKNLLISSKVLPEKALSQGFVFQYPDLEHSLRKTY